MIPSYSCKWIVVQAHTRFTVINKRSYSFHVCVPFSQLSPATLLHVEFDGLQFSYRCLTRIYCTPFRSVSRFIQKYSGNRNFYGCRSFLQLNFDTACLQAKKRSRYMPVSLSLSLPVFGINETTFHLKSFYHLLINA